MTEPRGRAVIVGAGLAGASAAIALREGGWDGEVQLIGTESQPPYERPPLSKSMLRGETPFEDALVRPPDHYPANGIDLRLGTTVTAVRPGDGLVETSDGERIAFDRLLIATGSRNRRPPIPGLDLPGVFDLRTAEDCERIRAAAVPGSRAVVAGMGFIGSEVAASLRAVGVEVTAVFGGAAPLERVLGERIGGVLSAIHADHGVVMVPDDRVEAFEGAGRVERVRTGRGRTFDCDFVVVGLGVEPVTDLLAGSGIDVDDGVLVDGSCRTNAPGVFAAGDVARHDHPVFGRIRVEHWQNAGRQGRAAARSMLGGREPYDQIHWFWSEQFERTIQYAGHHTGWDELIVRGSLEERTFCAFYVQDGLVRAAVGMDVGPEVHRCEAIIAAGAPVDPAALRDDSVDLRTLAPTRAP